ncbi:MAG: hypothetical protein COA58_09820 [Bacteroidetes bacterium]|nr:MAG: hypothetical protein COA58_09820 [Bacteroidota bacterium]
MKRNEDKEQEQLNNPLHGVKLKEVLEFLISYYGWDGLGDKIDINCFQSNPSMGSSLKFLRRTPWARAKVEKLYLDSIPKFKK